MWWAGTNTTLDPSTVFVDFLGPLGGENVATWTAAAANKAVEQQRQQIQAAVRKGLIARAAADWHVSALPWVAFAPDISLWLWDHQQCCPVEPSSHLNIDVAPVGFIVKSSWVC